MSVEVTGVSAASVTGAIRKAALTTGTSFDYLLATARVESNLNPGAKASTSSAGGLFQFIDQTWLGTLKHAGPALGYGKYADAIAKNSAGRYEVQDPALRQQIFDLRNDASANAAMAGAFTKWNGDWLSAKLGRAPTEGELYLAHFLGAGGASKLITAASASPQADAAAVFPRAAGANRSMFYNKQGEPRSVAQVYDLVVGRYDVARARSPAGPATLMAAATATPTRAALPVSASQSSGPVAWQSVALPHLPPLLTPPTAAPPVARTVNAGPSFHGLFQTSERREAVAPVVSALWSTRAATQAPPPHSAKNDPKPTTRSTFDLFRDSG
jgi:Transglycosylase SLT domain